MIPALLFLTGALMLAAAALLAHRAHQWRRALAQSERQELTDSEGVVVTSTRLRTARCECGATVLADAHGEPLPHVGCAIEEGE